MRSKFIADWEKIDWTKSDRLIAEELSCSRTPVYKARREFAPDTVIPPPDFSNVDWTMPNQQIADMLRTTYSNVAAQRSLQGHAWEGGNAWQGKAGPKHRSTGRKRRKKEDPRDPFLTFAHTPTVAFILTKLMRAMRNKGVDIPGGADDGDKASWLVGALSGSSATQHLMTKLRFNKITLTFKAIK